MMNPRVRMYIKITHDTSSINVEKNVSQELVYISTQSMKAFFFHEINLWFWTKTCFGLSETCTILEVSCRFYCSVKVHKYASCHYRSAWMCSLIFNLGLHEQRHAVKILESSELLVSLLGWFSYLVFVIRLKRKTIGVRVPQQRSMSVYTLNRWNWKNMLGCSSYERNEKIILIYPKSSIDNTEKVLPYLWLD